MRPSSTDGGNDVKSVLVLELGGIGDVILAVPAIIGIGRTFPGARVTVVTVERARAVLERFTDRWGEHVSGDGAGIEQRVVDLNGGVALSREDFSKFLSLRRERYDLLVDLSAIESGSADFRRRLLVRVLAPGRSAGRGTDGRGGFFDVRTEERLEATDHELDRKLAVVAALGGRSPLSAPIFPILRHEREEADAFFAKNGIDGSRPLTAIHPGGTGVHKRWPAERFGEAACWLAGNLGAVVVVVGGPENEGIIERVRSVAGGEAVLSAPFLSLGAVGAILERCSLFLTNDSGPMHLAAALGVPTVAIFGQTNRARYAPLLPESRRACSYADPAQCVEDWMGGENEECRRSDCREPGCLQAVSVSAVIEQLESLCSRIGLFYHLEPGDGDEEAGSPLPGDVTIGRDTDTRTGGNGRGVGRTAGTPACRPEPGDRRDGAVCPAGLPAADAGFITRRARARAVDLLRGTGGVVLAVACGKGYLLGNLTAGAGANRRVWGVDISTEQLSLARDAGRGGSDSGGSSRFVAGDIAALPFRSGTFDTAVCVNTLLNLAGGVVLTGALFEMARVTKQGGTVLVELRNSRNPLVGLRFLLGKRLRGVPLHTHRLGDVLESARKAGLALRAKHAVGPAPGPLAYSSILEFEKEDEW